MSGLRWKNIGLGIVKGGAIGGAIQSITIPVLFGSTLLNMKEMEDRMPRRPGEPDLSMADMAMSQWPNVLFVGWPIAALQFAFYTALLLSVFGLPLLYLSVKSGRGGRVLTTGLATVVAGALLSPLLYLFVAQMAVSYLVAWICWVVGAGMATHFFWKAADPEDLHYQSYKNRTGAAKSPFLDHVATVQDKPADWAIAAARRIADNKD